MTATIVCEIPYAEMKADSYDPSGWLEEMDLVCDGDREVVVVVCNGDMPQKPSQIIIPRPADARTSNHTGSADMAKTQEYKEKKILYKTDEVREDDDFVWRGEVWLP